MLRELCRVFEEGLCNVWFFGSGAQVCYVLPLGCVLREVSNVSLYENIDDTYKIIKEAAEEKSEELL